MVCLSIFAILSGKRRKQAQDSSKRKEQTMKRRNLKIISLLLTAVMIVCAIPMTASATDVITPIVEDTTQVPDEQMYTGTLDYDNPDIPRPVTEMEARREENVKHFLLPDGTMEAVVYSNAVHRKNASGEWEDIDNTLSGNNAKVPDLYVTDDLRVAFAKTFSAGGQLFALNENGYGISMKLMTDQISTSPMLPITEISSASTSAAVSTVTVTNAATRGNKKQWDTIDEAITVNNASSIIYTNVRSNTDLEYTLDGNNIKENIIVKAASNSYVYTFELGLSGLTPVLCEDGSITLSDSETGETQYIIPAPYMYDANGEVSYEVYYTLTEKSDGAYTLKITANAEWMNAENRTFPVVIDPTVTSDATVDTYINSSSPTSTYGSSNQLWISSTKTTFIKLPTPNYPSGFTITNAYLYVAYYYYDNVTSNSLTAGAYQVNMGWAEGSLSWNGANNYSNLGISTTRLSSASFSGSQGAYENTPKWVRFDITSAATAWNSGTSNNGIALKRESGTNGSVILKSTEAGSYSPYILVHYTEPRVTDGVYKIKNVSTGKYVDVTDSGTASGTQLQQWSGTATDGNRAQLFKITFVYLSGNTNYYTVRPLTNCGQGMNIPALDGTATVNTLQPEESWSGIPWNQSIAIISNGNNYVIKSGGSSSEQYLTAPSSGTNGTKLYSSTLESMSSAWILEPYTTAIDGTELVSFTPYLVPNETFTYQAVMFSSTIGRNGPPTYLVRNEDGTTTDKATIDATTGELTAYETGTIRVGATYPGAGSNYWYRFVYIEEDMSGTYFFKNVELGNYMQIDDNAAISDNGAKLELWNFDGESDQKWNLEYAAEGYYKIISVASGKVVTAPTTLDDSVTQTTNTTTNTKLWRFNYSSGMYGIVPQYDTSNSKYLAAGDGILTDAGRNVELRESQSDNKDKWYLILCTNLDPIEIEIDIFCDITLLDYDTEELSEEEKEAIYAERLSQIEQRFYEATAPFITEFNIQFVVKTITYSNEIDLDSNCDSANIWDGCTSFCAPVASCNEMHHHGASRILNTLKSDETYTCRLVGYALCWYDNGQHKMVEGLADVGGKDSLVYYRSGPETITTIQHELSHNLGAPDFSCTSDQNCVLSYSSNQWCDNCSAAIRNTINGQS